MDTLVSPASRSVNCLEAHRVSESQIETQTGPDPGGHRTTKSSFDGRPLTLLFSLERESLSRANPGVAVRCDPSGWGVSLSLAARMKATLLPPPRPGPRPAIRLARRRTVTVGHAEVDFLGRPTRAPALTLLSSAAVE